MASVSVVVPVSAVVELMRSATDNVLIVAPYIKAGALRKIISVIPDTVSSLKCVTRWLPEDIVSGACDLEIFDLITDRQGWDLYVYPHLHAKYYRTSNSAMIGSANISSRALGWSSPPNVELLVRLPVDLPGLAEWEKHLLNSTVLATIEVRDQIAKKAAILREEGTAIPVAPEVEAVLQKEGFSKQWFPKCPVPERLWEVYNGTGVDTMVSSAREGAERDLVALAPYKGLSKDIFKACVVGILKRMPVIEGIDQLSSNGLSDDQAIAFLEKKLGANTVYTHEEIWRILKNWLMYFFPDDYRFETTQVTLVKSRTIVR